MNLSSANANRQGSKRLRDEQQDRNQRSDAGEASASAEATDEAKSQGAGLVEEGAAAAAGTAVGTENQGQIQPLLEKLARGVAGETSTEAEGQSGGDGERSLAATETGDDGGDQDDDGGDVQGQSDI